MDEHTLPTESQRTQISQLVQRALVEIRLISLAEGNGRRVSDLADAFHNLLAEADGWGKWNRDVARGMLQSYQDKYSGDGRPPMFDYVAAFDNILTFANDRR